MWTFESGIGDMGRAYWNVNKGEAKRGKEKKLKGEEEKAEYEGGIRRIRNWKKGSYSLTL